MSEKSDEELGQERAEHFHRNERAAPWRHFADLLSAEALRNAPYASHVSTALALTATQARAVAGAIERGDTPPPRCLYDPMGLHQLDLECPQRLKGSDEKKCGGKVAFRFTWPGQTEQVACERHAKLARHIAEAMGFSLELRELSR